MSESPFNSFFEKKAANEPVQRINASKPEPEYAVIPEKLVEAYEGHEVSTPQKQPSSKLEATSIVYEMEELRKTRAESQQIANSAVLNQTIRAQKSQIDELSTMVEDLVAAFKQVESDLKEFKQEESEFTQKQGKFGTDVTSELDMIEQKISDISKHSVQSGITAPTAFSSEIASKDQLPSEQPLAPTMVQTEVQQEEKPAFGQKPPSTFEFGEPEATTVEKDTPQTEVVEEAADGLSANNAAQPDPPKVTFGEPPDFSKPPEFTFGAQPPTEAPNNGFGETEGGFGQTTEGEFKFGTATSGNPFSGIFKEQ